jgi:hypothetical protein
VQLIANDFLETVPFAALGALIDVVRAYCAQSSDTNISFTSIGLLWRISDYIHKTKQQQQQQLTLASASQNGDAVAATPAPSDSSAVPESPAAPIPSDLSDALADSLMQQVFTSLASLSLDSRTEVRNSAVKTLHNALATHAARMTLANCVHVLHTLVLPLLSRLLLDSKELEASARHAAFNSTELGKDKTTGKSVMMLIHYSRDTASKQWDETRTYALQGTARVLKGYIDNLARSVAAAGGTGSSSEADQLVRSFEPQWLHYLQLNLAALANRSPEVTLAALNAVLDLVAMMFAASSSSSSSSTTATNATSGLLSPSLLQTLWTPVLERFYVRGVLHALTQHRHVEWVEERERALDAERKQARATAVAGGASASAAAAAAAAVPSAVDYAASPFQTSFDDLNAEDGWKSWLKTYTHLLGNLQTLLPLVRRNMETTTAAVASSSSSSSVVGAAPRNDLILLLHLSHVLVKMHSHYTEQRARALYLQRKQTSAGNASNEDAEGVPLTIVDRKETPLQAAHLKLLESLCVAPVLSPQQQQQQQQPSPSSSSLSPSLWDAVFDQLLTCYLQSDYAEHDVADAEAQLNALLAGSMPVAPQSKNALKSAAAASASAAPLQFASTSFVKKVLRVLDRLYTSVAPSSVRAAQFGPVLLVLQRVLHSAATFLRDQGYQELCEEAVAALIHVLDAGLPSVNERMARARIDVDADKQQSLAVESERLRGVWHTIVSIFASFLASPAVATTLASSAAADDPSVSEALFDHSAPVLLPLRPSAAQQRVWENLQIALVGCLVRVVLPQVAHVPAGGRTLQALVSFLNIGFVEDESSGGGAAANATLPNGTPLPANADGGASIAPATNELLSHSCLMALFLLSRAGSGGGVGGGGAGALASSESSPYGAPLAVASLAAPLLLHRCQCILSAYLSHERLQAPNVPMPRSRREELAFVLRELCTLQLHPQVAAKLQVPSASPNSSQPQQSSAPSRAHLLKLFPVLCQCITMREPELRELLRDVFMHASVELGLQPSA